MRFVIVPLCLKYCACHETVGPGHMKCRTCHAKSSPQNWRFDVPNAAPLKRSALWPLNISAEHVSCTTHATRHASFEILFKRPTPAILRMLQNLDILLTFDKVHDTLRLPRKTISERPKWSEHVALLTLWLRKVLRATRACTFRHLNFQKWSRPVVLLTFWHRHAFRATTACAY